MDSFYVLIVIAALAFLVLSPVIAVIAARRVGRVERRLRLLERRLRILEGDDVKPEVPEGAAEPAATPAAPIDPWTTPESAEPEAITASARQSYVESAATADKVPSATKTIEERVASQWLVWLGGLTIALAGIFLVKYGIENQLLSPAVRVVLGFLLGLVLVCGGEWLRQRPLQRVIASIEPDYVPPALTGAGVLVCFGSVYASYAFLGLLAPLISFVVLAAIAVGAMALSLLQGPYIGALGILGAFAVPLMVSTDSGSAWALFPYLLVIATSAIAVVRYKVWWWLAWAALAGAAFWDAFWLFAMWRAGDLIPTSIHLLGMFALALGASNTLFSEADEALSWPFETAGMTSYERFVAGAALVLVILVFAMVRIDGYSVGSLLVVGIVGGLLTVIAWRIHRLESVAAIAAALPILLLVTWHLPDIVTLPEQIVLGGRVLGALPVPIVPPEFSTFALVAGLASLWFGGAGFVVVRRGGAAVYWATISAAVPLLTLSVAFWRIAGAGVELAWAVVAMGLASVATLAAVRLGNRPGDDPVDPAVGIYALAVIAAISLAASMTLENTWLTVALVAQIPAAAWVHNRIGIPALRWVAFVIAAIVGARLLLAHQLPGFNWGVPKDPLWVLYGYGLPAVAFALAAHWFRKSRDDRLVLTLESGAIAIAVATISMEIRQFLDGMEWMSGRYTLLEQSLHSISWLVSGYALYRRNRIERRLSTEWGAKILIGLAALQVVLLQLLTSNPVRTGENIGSWPIVDVLALAYFVPALLATAIFFEAKRQGHKLVGIGAGIAAGLLLFSYITLEVRHIFHGSQLDVGAIGNAEGYSYSVAWLLYAAALFAVGFLWRVAAIRHAALALTILIIAKVFLWDMSGLTGLYRVASFLGLGLSLVAIGFFYQRYMFGDRGEPDDKVVETE